MRFDIFRWFSVETRAEEKCRVVRTYTLVETRPYRYCHICSEDTNIRFCAYVYWSSDQNTSSSNGLYMHLYKEFYYYNHLSNLVQYKLPSYKTLTIKHEKHNGSFALKHDDWLTRLSYSRMLHAVVISVFSRRWTVRDLCSKPVMPPIETSIDKVGLSFTNCSLAIDVIVFDF